MQKASDLNKVLGEYYDYSEGMAQAEKDYLVSKGVATLELKEQGMQATLIPAIVKGQVADSRLAFKIAESQFHTCRERIKAIHAQLEAYRSLLSTAKAEIQIR